MADNPFDLTGRVALVTGGNSGIGLGIAVGLAKAGCDVCIWGTNETKNADALANLKETGANVSAIRCDVSDADAVEKAFARTLDTHGRVDGCFANAGVGGRGVPFDQFTEEEW
ncbi:MAG TPA: SDR family NAD(P)-dependent oxidoreductase, partial [Pseudomonadales bacterium]|nr:SDR family NAD(P)-dependent oxidoreductase [Pseudomonadales bacterium]